MLSAITGSGSGPLESLAGSASAALVAVPKRVRPGTILSVTDMVKDANLAGLIAIICVFIMIYTVQSLIGLHISLTLSLIAMQGTVVHLDLKPECWAINS